MSIPQLKILRVYQLIRLLSNKPYCTFEQLADRLGMSTKTIGRYFRLLEEIGYTIDSHPVHKYRFIIIDKYPAENGIQLTWQETELIAQLLHANANGHVLQGDILKKLLVAEKFYPMADQVLNTNNSPKVDKLVKAINQQRRVRLINYRSPSSNTTSNRLVEPISFSDDYQIIDTHDLHRNGHRRFRVDRMEDVEILEQKITFKGQLNQADFFGFTGIPFIVQLHLNMNAYELLTAEYPATQPYIQTNPKDIPDYKEGFPYYFEAPVCDNIGIGRFLLGLPGDALVAAPQGLRDYLNKRMEWRF